MRDSQAWGDLTDDDIRAARDRGVLIVLPVGATEQHASHLPVDTDTNLATQVSLLAAARARSQVLVAPEVAYGFSPHHNGYAGTITLSASTLMSLVKDVVISLHNAGFNRILIVNGHGGNLPPLRVAVAELVTSGVPVSCVDYWGPAADVIAEMLKGTAKRPGHACEFETALQLALHARDDAFVRKVLEAAVGLPARSIQPYFQGEGRDPIETANAFWPPVFTGDTYRYFGDPAEATLGNGKLMLETVIACLSEFYDSFSSAILRVGQRD